MEQPHKRPRTDAEAPPPSEASGVSNGLGPTNGHGPAYPQLYTQKYSISHEHALTAVKVSPDGTHLATSLADGLIRVYDLGSGALRCSLSGHTRGVSDVAFSPINNDILASCSDDLTVRLWLVLRRKCIKILKKHTYHVTTLHFILKGNLLITGSADETITIWDLSSGKSLKTLAAHSDPVSSLSLTPDDTVIVSASFDGLMRLFDLETGQCLKTLVYNSANHGTATASTNDVVNFPISHVQTSPNGKYILSSSLDGKIRLWDYMGNKVIKTYAGPHDSSICEKYNCTATFITATTEPLVVSGTDSQGLLFWDVQTKQIVGQINVPSAVFDIDLKDGGGTLVCCTQDGTVRVFSLNSEYVSKPVVAPTSTPE